MATLVVTHDSSCCDGSTTGRLVGVITALLATGIVVVTDRLAAAVLIAGIARRVATLVPVEQVVVARLATAAVTTIKRLWGRRRRPRWSRRMAGI
jgi:hypothetical protein